VSVVLFLSVCDVHFGFVNVVHSYFTHTHTHTHRSSSTTLIKQGCVNSPQDWLWLGSIVQPMGGLFAVILNVVIGKFCCLGGLFFSVDLMFYSVVVVIGNLLQEGCFWY
jgi:hypothetical protein